MTSAYEISAWSLEALFPAYNAEEVKVASAALEDNVTTFEAFRERLAPEISAKEFVNIVQNLEKIEYAVYRLYGFAGLSFAADTQNQAIQAFMAGVQQQLTTLENRTMFFSLWWKDLDDANAQRLMAEAGDYRYWLEQMRQFKPHTLTEAEEKVVNVKNVTGVNAMHTLYDTITNRYTFKLMVEGDEKSLTRGELMTYVRQSDSELRAAAYQELYRVYGEDGPILGQMYQVLVRDWRNEQVEMRKFSAPIAARNLVNDVPDEVIDTLLEVCRENSPVFQRFFRIKARWLGIEKLRRYDIYAPVAQAEKNYPFEQGAQLVLDSFTQFDPHVADLARKVFDNNQLDSQVRKGKRGGAFCWSVTPDLPPWVLVNYQGRSDDVATLAHELGHAIHAMLAEGHSLFTYHSSLPLAETASTFAEMMLVDLLLERESDENVRRDLLFRQVDDAYATILRQAFFALFERQAHDMVLQGASVDELSQAYMENLRAQFGEGVEIGDEFRWEWVSIPHIYQVPFYVYAYTFGQLLVLSLYRQYQEEGEAFKPRYLNILAAGGSESPERILRKAGVDIRSREFWQGGFDVISKLLDQLELLPV
jgi:oligoendopeptidase F